MSGARANLLAVATVSTLVYAAGVSIGRIQVQAVDTSEVEAYLAGQVEALHDLASGSLRVRTAGYPVPWYQQEARLLRSEFAIELVPVAGCVVSTTQSQAIRGYNQVTLAIIQQRFGSSVFEEATARAVDEAKKARQ